MNTFINIKKDLKPDVNFWDLNPHLRFVNPFSFLYNQDSSKNKDTSSKHMWCIFFLSEPDENINLYYRLSYDELIKVCENFNPDFNIEDELILQCVQEYPEICLTVIERLLKTTKDLFKKRNSFLKEAEYNFETMTAIDNAIAKTPKMEEDFDKIVQKYIEDKNKEVQLYGGRKLTAREKKTIKVDLNDDTEFRTTQKGSDTN
jgi:hypothetical protein